MSGDLAKLLLAAEGWKYGSSGAAPSVAQVALADCPDGCRRQGAFANELLEPLFATGKPVVNTEFGMGTYVGADQKGMLANVAGVGLTPFAPTISTESPRRALPLAFPLCFCLSNEAH